MAMIFGFSIDYPGTDTLVPAIELAEICVNVNVHNTRYASLIYAKPHRTIYGFNAPLERCLRNFSKFDEIFEFHLSRNQFKNRILVE
jgi:hypothetical protein